MKKYLIIASILLLAASCTKQPVTVINYPNPTPTATITPTPLGTASSTPMELPIKYNNIEYGFIFSLPEDWKGYSTYLTIGQDIPLEGSKYKTPVSIPTVHIRNPNWTKTKPYEDIPVTVYTLDEWSEVQNGFFESAAPFPPLEFGRNAKYVFALPARFDYDFRTGFQEVEQIVASNPLQAY